VHPDPLPKVPQGEGETPSDSSEFVRLGCSQRHLVFCSEAARPPNALISVTRGPSIHPLLGWGRAFLSLSCSANALRGAPFLPPIARDDHFARRSNELMHRKLCLRVEAYLFWRSAPVLGRSGVQSKWRVGKNPERWSKRSLLRPRTGALR